MLFSIPGQAFLTSVILATTTVGAPCAQKYDYVIVGGGLTGLVAAARLSENPQVTVLVLEYGPADRSNVTQIPYYGSSLNTKSLRTVKSAVEPYLGNQVFNLSVSGVAGGGSQVNGMQWDLPSAADINAWEALRNPGWGWDGLLPYYKKAMTFTAPEPETVAQYNYSYDASAHGSNGPAQASFPDFQWPDMYTLKDGLTELGIPFVEEHARGNAVGQFWTPTALDPKTMTRSSALYAYYDKVSYRKNLNLLLEHQVIEILFDSESKTADLVAKGVNVLNRATNETVQFHAAREVIMAAGGMFTPHLLQVSGIGPKSVLEAAGIETKLDLPAVGTNFQDHPTAYTAWSMKASFPNPTTLTTNATFWAEAVSQYQTELSGPLTKAQANYIAFLSLAHVTEDAESLFAAAESQEPLEYLPAVYASNPTLLAGYMAQRKLLINDLRSGSSALFEIPIIGGATVANSLQKPLSRGTVTLDPANPHGNPVVFHHALQNPFDRTALYHLIQFTRRLMASKAVSSVLQPVETRPGANYTTEDQVINAMLASTWLKPTFSHPSSTCAMMPRSMGGVVDSELRVYGTNKLSIIDGSILPIIPAAHLQATMYAVAEKASDIIKRRNRT